MSKFKPGNTLCVLYGLNEGPVIGGQFEQACTTAGFAIVNDPAKADYIFAHSGGCLLIPPINQAKTVVLVGIPYWPSRPWLFSTVIKVWREAKYYHSHHQLRHWGRKWLYHTYYAFNISAGLQMWRNLSPTKPWNSPQPQVILRNNEDAYCSPEVFQIDFRGPRKFVSMQGGHDDCWIHPKRYIRLLQSVA